jgi:crotonobetainyl-CoA:carnitine CoA-transferase CaiB-like acyl-CoA transferase
VIGVATNGQLEKLCEIFVMDHTREELKVNKACFQHRDLLNAEIQGKFLAKRDLKDLVREMTARTIPFSEIISVKQLFEDPEI